ncbi:MAG: hypothetical protein H6815_02715 [Phycisphaeraceae bacterium]|nr:hypothetical protein [Phycisphaerales bacterium]MCB9859339.1 hypothetical protein [Phycisphaeraceae bacterium]
MDKSTHNHSRHSDVAQRCAISEADALAMIEDCVQASDAVRLRRVLEQNEKCAQDVATYRRDRQLVKQTSVPAMSSSVVQAAIDFALVPEVDGRPSLDFTATKLTTLEDYRPSKPWHAHPIVRRIGSLAAVVVFTGAVVVMYELVREQFVHVNDGVAINGERQTNSVKTEQGAINENSHVARADGGNQLAAAVAKSDSSPAATSQTDIAPVVATQKGITIASVVPPPQAQVPVARALELARERKLIVMLESNQPTVLADRVATLLTSANESAEGSWALALHTEEHLPGTLAAIDAADLHVSTRLGPNAYASEHAPRVFTDMTGNSVVSSEPMQLIYTLQCAMTESALANAIDQLADAGGTGSTMDVNCRIVFVELPEPMPETPQATNADAVLWWTAPVDVWAAEFQWAHVPVIIGHMN